MKPTYPRPTIYIAGPMRGYPKWNFPAFDEARDRAKAQGWAVISSADLDREVGFTEDRETLDGFDMEAAIDRDLAAIQGLEPGRDAIAMLPGWENSKGARAEKAVAEWRGVEVVDARDFKLLTRVYTAVGEQRYTDPKTGGQKGVKPERYDLLPWDAVDEVARVYAYGASKYADRNWEKGYPFGNSIAAAFRHLRAFSMGEDIDRDSGEWRTHHLASVVFHCLALMAWQLRGRGELDNRPVVEKDAA